MKYFSLTDIGKKREKNEDSYYSQINNYAGTTVTEWVDMKMVSMQVKKLLKKS